jgi:hypothetical protein
MEKYRIEIAFDTNEVEAFCAWLNEQGHDAWIGKSTGSYIDGDWTSHYTEEGINSEHPYSEEIMRELWEGYCNS